MKCERCQRNPATQAVRGEKNGQPCELFVCDECARPPAKTAGALSLADILFSLGMPKAGNAPAPAAQGADAPGAPPPTRAPALCPGCGLSRETLRERRRFGCPVCYDTFEDDVKSFLRELQYGDSHVGRKPGKTARRESLAALEARLADAIRREDFGKAAELRNDLARQRPPQPPSGKPADGET